MERTFWRQKDQQSSFYKIEKLFKIDDINVDKILVSERETWHKKVN